MLVFALWLLEEPRRGYALSCAVLVVEEKILLLLMEGGVPVSGPFTCVTNGTAGTADPEDIVLFVTVGC